MLTYIIRRVLLMIPTLFGITVMVFLIARFAPGRPGQQQLEGAGLGAEEARALADWYEKRYGLDLPLWRQYLRWWRGMFTRDLQAQAWCEDGDALLPVHTYRKTETDYFARSAAGRWFAVRVKSFDPVPHGLDDAALLERIDVAQLAAHPQRRAGYADPVHVFAEVECAPLEPQESPREASLKRALSRVDVQVEAPAWSDPGGEALYLNPAHPDRPLFQRAGAWYELTPSLALTDALINSIDTPAVAAILKGRMSELPGAEPDYSIPRHAFVRGSYARVDASYDEKQLQRLTLPARARAPAGVWAAIPGTEKATMLYEAAEPLPRLLVEKGGEWLRLYGGTRTDLPAIRIIPAADPEFQSRVPSDGSAKQRRTTGEERIERAALLRGRLAPLGPGEPPPLARDTRRYQHEFTSYEVTLGMSLSNEPVAVEIKRRLPVTLLINFIAFPLIYLIAIPVGMLMAVKRGRGFDQAANVSLLGMWSVPQVLAATLLIGYLAVGGAGLHWFPSGGLSNVGSESLPFFGSFQPDGSFRAGWLLDRLWHLVLPVFCILYGSIAYIAKQQRAAMLDNFTMDYVRTARAKGVPGKDIVFRHVLRNSLLPLITIFATILPALIAGSIILEKIFNIEGMGLLAFRAVQNRDYDVVQALALIAGGLNLLGLLLADICYALADPRITYR